MTLLLRTTVAGALALGIGCLLQWKLGMMELQWWVALGAWAVSEGRREVA